VACSFEDDDEPLSCEGRGGGELLGILVTLICSTRAFFTMELLYR
jgi:hypothetical protein